MQFNAELNSFTLNIIVDCHVILSNASNFQSIRFKTYNHIIIRPLFEFGFWSNYEAKGPMGISGKS